MNPSLALVLLITGSMSSAAAIAQSPAVAVLKPQPASVNCPVQLEVSQEIPGHLLLLQQNSQQAPQTRSGTHPPTKVRIWLINPTLVDITAMDILVHGSSDYWRIEKAQASTAQPSGITKSFSLSFRVQAMTNASTRIEVKGFSTVGQVDIISVTFADGSSWHESTTSSCHAAPSAPEL